MLNKVLSLVLILSLLSVSSYAEMGEENIPVFGGLNDPKLLQYTEDHVYAELTQNFANEDYIIENVKAIYISQEYLDEMAFNSQANIFFVYTLEEIGDEFKETGFIFTLGDNDTTVVKPFEQYDNIYERVIQNVAIGTGVILVCVTVSVVTGGTTSIIFAAAAKTGMQAALTGMVLGGAAAGIVKGYETGDMNEALKAAALQGSESFKWGAISGSVFGGLQKLRAVHKAAKAVDDAIEYTKGAVGIPDDLPKWRQAELRALNEYGGYEQLSYLDGELVDFGTTGATRPDIVRLLGDHIEAVEVKYYDLESSSCLNMLYNELKREVSARIANLPAGSTQRIILDVTERGYDLEIVENVAENIWSILDDIYPHIPIDYIGLCIIAQERNIDHFLGD